MHLRLLVQEKGWGGKRRVGEAREVLGRKERARYRQTQAKRQRDPRHTERVGQTGRQRNEVTAEGVPIFSLLIWVGSSLDTRRYWMT